MRSSLQYTRLCPDSLFSAALQLIIHTKTTSGLPIFIWCGVTCHVSMSASRDHMICRRNFPLVNPPSSLIPGGRTSLVMRGRKYLISRRTIVQPSVPTSALRDRSERKSSNRISNRKVCAPSEFQGACIKLVEDRLYPILFFIHHQST